MPQQKRIFRLNNKLIVLNVVLAFLLVISLVGNIILLANIRNNSEAAINKVTDLIIQPVSAAEIYPEFVCGCCGKPLDPDNICCGDMQQKIDYIDTLINGNLSKDEIMVKAVKEFGLNSLAKEEAKTAIKNQLIANAPAESAQIIFTKEKDDLGIVSQSQGIVSAAFEFKNEGSGDLVIDKLTTSCGCTSASIIYRGVEGPIFTMPGHGKDNPTDWSVVVAPGEIAQVKVYYDPNAHGPQKTDKQFITRTISVFSNDPVEFAKQLRIELEQRP